MIGKLIKAFAIILLIALIAVSLFYGLQLQESVDDSIGLVVIIVGCVYSVFSFSLLYGYGHLVDTNHEMNKKMDNLIAALKQTNTPPQYGTPYTAPVVPVVPVAPVAPVAPVIEPEPTITVPSSVPVTPVVDSLDDTITVPADPQPVTQEASGWICPQCGAQHVNLTAFCKFCGSKRV